VFDALENTKLSPTAPKRTENAEDCHEKKLATTGFTRDYKNGPCVQRSHPTCTVHECLDQQHLAGILAK
jgi:hypothetical protein